MDGNRFNSLNALPIFEELKKAIEKEQIKAIHLNKRRAFKMEEGLFFNAGDISAFFKIELYLFYKTAVEHLEHFNQVITPKAPLPKQSVEEEVIIPIRGNPESMQEWIKHVITEEKGLALDKPLYAGLQAELIRRDGGQKCVACFGLEIGTQNHIKHH